jgi:hypothetical protein
LRRRYPLLARPIDWATIQNIESELIMSAMTSLAFASDVPSLPVHDSIIVPAIHVGRAAQVVVNEFERKLGVTPRLRISTSTSVLQQRGDASEESA